MVWKSQETESSDESEEKQRIRLVRETALEIVNQQIAEESPQETLWALNRLLRAGYSREAAIEAIAAALAEEIWGVSHDNRELNIEHYRALLDELK